MALARFGGQEDNVFMYSTSYPVLSASAVLSDSSDNFAGVETNTSIELLIA
jgi:hypothetical protein